MQSTRAPARSRAVAALIPNALALLVSGSACDGRDLTLGSLARGAPLERPTAQPGRPAVVDSSLPLDEALRRFRVGLPVVARLSGGASTREELVRRFVEAVAQRDTPSVRAMALSRAEFAYLYYPDSPFTRDPHRQMAGLVWLLTKANSSKGITRAFDRLGGRPLSYRSHRCSVRPRVEGRNRVWEGCVVHLGDWSEVGEMRLFGSIVERDGRLKFVSYANDF